MRVDDKVISEDEAALYDRQIRLWGVDAQRKLLSSRILLINMQGLGAEIAKNLVLSGINTLTILDSSNVTEQDLNFNFLISHSHVGKNRAQACLEALQTLNPMVKVYADLDNLETKNSEYFSQKNFDIVCMLSGDLDHLRIVNNYCRVNNVLFLCGHVYGLYGFMFVDFNNYQFIVQVPKISEDTFEKKKTTNCCPTTTEKTEEKLTLEERTINFKSFEAFLADYKNVIQDLGPKKLKRLSKTYFLFLIFKAFNEEHKRSFIPESVEDFDKLLQLKKTLFESLKLDQELLSDSQLNENKFSEFSPVNAILGGVIAQEVIKAISKKNEPIENFFVFDGNQMSGEVMKI